MQRPVDPDAQQTHKPHVSIIVIGSLAVLLLIVALVVAVLIIKHKSSGHREPTTVGTPTNSTQAPQRPSQPPLPGVPFVPSANLGANCQYPPSQTTADKPVNPPRTGKVSTAPAQISADLVTNQGHIGLMLANNESPCTVNSFTSLAQQGFFDGTRCHRLTKSPNLAVLQCGDPLGTGTGGPGYQFADEYPVDQFPPEGAALHRPVVYPRGTVAMANAGPHTNGSQFFLVYKDSQLPPAYTVFGTVQADGLATLDEIAAHGVKGGSQDGPPAVDVTITSVQLD